MKLKLLAILLLFAVGGVALVVTFGGLPRSAAAATTYLTSTAEVADVSDDVAATGSVESTTSWNLQFGAAAAEVTSADASSSTANALDTGTWTVKAVSVRVGDVVKKDQVLATGTNSDLTASIVAAKNDWRSARLNELQAQDAYDNATQTAQIRQTRSALLNATNQVASAKQAYNDLRATATHNRLVAAAAGIVTAIDITPGADAPSGTAITIASNDYEVTASVVESDVPSLKLDQAATVAVSALGAEIPGKVTAIAPTATASTSGSVVSFAVTVALANPPATLRPGMTADVTITTASASGVLAVPAAAIRGAADNYTVLVLTAAGTPEAKPVTVGLMTSSLVEVTSGLNQGDVVVTGTSSTQRTTGTGGGAGGIVVPGGGGNFRGGPGN